MKNIPFVNEFLQYENFELLCKKDLYRNFISGLYLIESI